MRRRFEIITTKMLPLKLFIALWSLPGPVLPRAEAFSAKYVRTKDVENLKEATISFDSVHTYPR